jgi:hypothetical protein
MTARNGALRLADLADMVEHEHGQHAAARWIRIMAGEMNAYDLKAIAAAAEVVSGLDPVDGALLIIGRDTALEGSQEHVMDEDGELFVFWMPKEVWDAP